MSALRFITPVSLAVLLASSPAAGQAGGDELVSVFGTLRAEDGSPIAGAVIEFQTEYGTTSIITDQNGEYRIAGLAPGMIGVEAQVAGFSTVVDSAMAEPGTMVSLDLMVDSDGDGLIIPMFPPDPPANGDGAGQVYNAEISPLESRDPLTLRGGETTTLAFFIGVPSPESVLGPIEVDTVITQLREPTELTVVLDCFVCLDDTNQLETMTYFPDSAGSSVARFTFVPERAKVDSEGGLGRLLLTVLLDGIEIEFIEIPLFVGTPTPEALAEYRPPRKYPAQALPEQFGRPPDAVLYVGSEEREGFLPVRLHAVNESLRVRLAELYQEPDGWSWSFRSGVGRDELEDLGIQTYIRLTEIVQNKNAHLDSIYAGTWSGSVELVNTQGRLLPEDSTQIVNKLHTRGTLFYLRLFEDAEQGLLGGIIELERFARDLDRPFRIRIHNTGPYAPWQLLYPSLDSLPVDPLKFWGFQYELGVRQAVSSASGRVATFIPKPGPDAVILGTNSEDSDLARRGQRMSERLSGHAGGDVLTYDHLDPFLTGLGNNAANVSLVMLFTHGDTGSRDSPFSLGQRLYFTSDEKFLPEDLDLLRLEHQSSQDRRNQLPFLRAQPIVLLNTCESIGGGLSRATNNDFAGTFLRNGASAVIATEAPVWVTFADRFATDVVDQLFDDQSDIARSLYLARHKHLDERRNPMGLLFALYGNPAAHYME